MRLERESAAIFFAACVSLLPGTVAAEIEEGTLLVHVIDEELPYERTLDRLEERVARLFAARG